MINANCDEYLEIIDELLESHKKELKAWQAEVDIWKCKYHQLKDEYLNTRIGLKIDD